MLLEEILGRGDSINKDLKVKGEVKWSHLVVSNSLQLHGL